MDIDALRRVARASKAASAHLSAMADALSAMADASAGIVPGFVAKTSPPSWEVEREAFIRGLNREP